MGTDSFTLCVGYLYLIQSLVCSVNWGILITFLCSDAMAFRLQKEGFTWAHGFMRIESITITVGKQICQQQAGMAAAAGNPVLRAHILSHKQEVECTLGIVGSL